MKTTFAIFVGILIATHALAETSPPSLAEQMTALLKTIEDTYHTYYTTNDANGELYNELDKLQKTVPPQMFLLAEQEPRSQAACDVFTWIAMKAW